jgi:hypothetical protein
MTRSTGREATSETAPEGAESEREMKNRFGYLCLVAGVLALAISGGAMAQGTITGAPGISGNGFIVTLVVPSVVGVQWNRNVYFDLGNQSLAGSCGSYPAAPGATYPCWWNDQAVAGGGSVATPMAISLFSNAPATTVTATVLGAAGNFGSSNATIGNVYYGSGALTTSNQGPVCGGYTQMSSSAATVFATASSPTPGWAADPNGRRFIFRVDNNLTPTGGAPTNQTVLTVSNP